MSQYILDNLKGQEIKELIVDGKITLEDLDTAALNKLLDYETDMLCLDEGDMDLIHACASRLDELNGLAMSDEEFLAVIKKAEEEYVSSNTNTLPVRTVKRRLASKKIWLVAAVIALLAATATITVSAFGLDMFEYLKDILGLSVGEKIDKDTITLVNNGTIEEYESIEELFLTTNLDILYPSELPNGSELEKVHISTGTNGGNFIEFIASDLSTYISVDMNIKTDVVNDYTEKLVVNGCTYYTFKNEVFAVCYYNDCYYYISSDTYENLILIINNMRETK